MSMAEDGLKIETAAGVTLRDAIRQHMLSFALAARTSRESGRAMVAAYVDGLSGALALTIAGRHGSKDDVVNATVAKLRECVERDLRHLGSK
jgi:hypothetical protein